MLSRLPTATRAACAALATLLLLSGCATPKGDNFAEQRMAVQEMREDTLNKLYTVEPTASQRIQEAAGYAVFSNVGINVILFSASNGYGIVEDMRTGEKTYMKMASAGIGIGLGVKDFRGVFVFTTEEAMRFFIEEGWDASAQADAAAKSGEKGGAWAGAVDVAPGIKLYQITEHGLALQATIQGTKYWKDADLNG